MADGIQWWGFSPGRSLAVPGCDIESLNILLVGSSDLRMVLQTLSDLQARNDAPASAAIQPAEIQFHIAESNLELVARQLLLLTVVMDQTDDISVQERTSLFLELFGNALVRPQTQIYLNETSKRLVRMVTDDDYLKECLPMVNLSSLRFRERDGLEALFKSWKSTVKFDIASHWEERVRRHLAARYDARHGVFDWDYNMKLLDMTSGISWPEYRDWRDTGVAFQLRDSAPYSEPNRSLSSCAQTTRPTGERQPVTSYWGDIVTGPFLAFNKRHLLQPEKKDRDTSSRDPQKAGNETMQVLSNIIESLRGPTPPQPSGLSSVHEEDETEGECSAVPPASCTMARKGVLDHVSIHFLRMEAIAGLGQQSKYKQFFHSAYFSNRMVHHLKADLSDVFTDNASLFTETVLFVLDLNKEKKAQHTERVTALAGMLNFQLQEDDEQSTQAATQPARSSILLYNRTRGASST